MQTIITNLLNQSSSQFTNFDFNSMVEFNGIMMGASDIGLFDICCGDNDDGVMITAYFKLKMSDFGIDNIKRLRHVYLGLECDGNLEIDIIADEKVLQTYQIGPRKTAQQRIRLTVRRNYQGRYWSFRIRNVSGCNFAVDSIQVMPIVRSNGITGD